MRAGLSHCVRARGSRPAGGHFHLRAQMKVTKAKGLNTDLTGSPGYNLRTRSVQLKRSLATDTVLPRKSMLRAEPTFFVVVATAASQIVLSPFALATFIWGRK